MFLFNDALNTFYLRLYGVEHMVKDHSDSERGNLLPPHRLLFRLAARVLLYASSHRQDVIPVVEHWLIIGLGLSQRAVNHLAGICVYTLSWQSYSNFDEIIK